MANEPTTIETMKGVTLNSSDVESGGPGGSGGGMGEPLGGMGSWRCGQLQPGSRWAKCTKLVLLVGQMAEAAPASNGPSTMPPRYESEPHVKLRVRSAVELWSASIVRTVTIVRVSCEQASATSCQGSASEAPAAA